MRHSFFFFFFLITMVFLVIGIGTLRAASYIAHLEKRSNTILSCRVDFTLREATVSCIDGTIVMLQSKLA